MEAVRDFLGRMERALDEFGLPAWIAAMVVGFILFVPIGLAILAYMIWSGRMGCGRFRNGWRRRGSASAQTGNTAFDAYREETLRRLETEREAFTAFLDRLRKAKDQAEFDQFMAEQRNGGPATGEGGQGGQGFGGQGYSGQSYSGPGGEPGPTPRTEAPGGGFGGASPYPA